MVFFVDRRELGILIPKVTHFHLSVVVVVSGGKFRPRLNTGERPIANKYREGKMKRTLKRESKSA